ncbi:type II secretion system protein [Deltaproteobacteria bacterium TL4]
MMMKNKKRTHKGFSLVEIVVSLGVFSVLVGSLLPLSKNFTNQNNNIKTAGEMAEIGDALTNYYRDTGSVPASGLLISLFEQPTGSSGTYWRGPYITGNQFEILHDYWGSPYSYVRSPKINGQNTVNDNRSLLLSPGANRTQEWILNSGDYTRVGVGDDLFRIISIEATKRAFEKETRNRIKTIMQNFMENRASVSFDELDVERTTEEVTNVGKKCPTTLIASNKINNIPNLGSYHKTDQWGNRLIWHQELNQFYSCGPNRIDDSSGSSGTVVGYAQISGDDIGGY